MAYIFLLGTQKDLNLNLCLVTDALLGGFVGFLLLLLLFLCPPLSLFFVLFCFVFCLFGSFFLWGAVPAAYGSSQMRVQSDLQLLADTTAHSNARSLTH